MITVYFETKGFGYTEQAATFEDEQTYLKCLPSLQEQARANGFEHVTESMN